jgi:hypothetical protein
MSKGALGFAVVLVLVFSLFVSGCSVLQQSSSSGGGESYFPHAQGNAWRMTATDGSSQTMTVEETAMVGSTAVQCFVTLTTSALGTIYTSEAYYRIDGTGVYAHGSPSSPSSTGVQFIAFPLEIGKSWQIVAGSYTTNFSVMAKENATVPAGTFDCYKITAIYTYGTTEVARSNLWLGNNAGIVKTTSSTSTIESVLAWKNF